MINKYVSDSAFNASEDLLLVPVPIETTGDMEGFAGQVLGRFVVAQSRLNSRKGLKAGEIMIIGHLAGEPYWMPAYSLALCGIHRRTEQGWTDTPDQLHEALDRIAHSTYREERVTLATAGIPGTGFSGLRGNADPEAIKTVLEEHQLSFTIYQDNLAGDRAALLTADPELTGTLPKL